MRTFIDGLARDSSATPPARPIDFGAVFGVLADALIETGIPKYSRSDNGPEMKAQSLGVWLGRIGSQTRHIKAGRLRGSAYCLSLNGRLANEFLDCETPSWLRAGSVVIEQRRQQAQRARSRSASPYGRRPRTRRRPWFL